MVVMIKTRWKRVLVFGVVVGVCALVWFLWRRGEVPEYEVIYLPMSEGAWSTAVLVNDRGQVAGYTMNAANNLRGFLWDEENGLVELPASDGNSCLLSDMNDRGQIVGALLEVGNDPNRRCNAFIWESGQGMKMLSEGDAQSTACAINDHGEVIGVLKKRHTPREGRVYATGQVVLWNASEGMRVIEEMEDRCSYIRGMNNSGQFAGLMESSDRLRTFVWGKSGKPVYLDAEISKVCDIDEEGNVLGTSSGVGCKLGVYVWNEISGAHTLFTYSDNTVMSCKMNDSGDIVVATSKDPVILFDKYQLTGGYIRALLHTSEGKTVRLDRVFGKDEYFVPRDINNHGWIVGCVESKSGATKSRAVLLKPE
jgi:uncharacterized membrane protein